MSICSICPRACEVNPEKKQYGSCGRGRGLFLARAALHFWEEPCISGNKGSGAVFFSGCNLHCKFCQNHAIAKGDGKEIGPERLLEIFFELKEQGANNINLVTPDHYLDTVVASLDRAKKEGLNLPIVYNTGSYLHAESVKRLEGLVDVYLPDFKYWEDDLAIKCANAPNYRDTALAAIAEMVRQTGPARFASESGDQELNNSSKDPDFDPIDAGYLITRGTIVRHLLLPGHIEDSKKIISCLHSYYGDSIYLSIMNQFTPLREIPGLPELSRRVSEDEYDALIDYAIELGVENGFFQEGDVAEESFIPSFDYTGI